MVYNTTQHPPPPPPTATHCTFTEGGGGEVREEVEGKQYTRGVENTNMTDYISSLLLNTSKDDIDVLMFLRPWG